MNWTTNVFPWRAAPLLLGLTFALVPLRPAVAQGGDPQQEIQELARRIDEQLKEIDRLLLESGKKNQARQKPKEMLQQSVEKSRAVEAGIDELIEKLNEQKNQSGGGGESQDQQQQQQDQQQGQPQQGGQQGKSQRRDSQTPDFVKQPQQGEQKPGEQQPGEQKPGEQQGTPPNPGEGKPETGQDDKGPGENRTGQTPPDQTTGPGQTGQGSESWGELQGYTNALKNRGSMPKVPEKYRKYWEAYLKQKPQPGGK